MSKKLTTEQVVNQFIEIHGTTYDYSLVEYTKAINPITIICPIHGIFQQTTSKHKRGQGCKKCGQIRSAQAKVGKPRKDIKTKYSTEQIVNQFIEIHGNKYDYSLVEYKKAHTNVGIICPIHGVFHQTPSNHKNGKGCLKCKNKTVTTENLITRLLKVFHSNEYDYTNTIYVNAKTKLKVKCNKCDGYFLTIPHQHLRGHGCPTCNQGNKSLTHTVETYRNRKTTLYYIKVNDVYKIGLTLKSIKARYSQDKNVKIENIKEWVFEDGSVAYNLEKKILRNFKEYQYKGKDILKGGNSELFTQDILEDLYELKILY